MLPFPGIRATRRKKSFLTLTSGGGDHLDPARPGSVHLPEGVRAEGEGGRLRPREAEGRPLAKVLEQRPEDGRVQEPRLPRDGADEAGVDVKFFVFVVDDLEVEAGPVL